MEQTCLVADTIYELTEQLEEFYETHIVTYVTYYVYPEYCAAEVKYKLT